MLLTNLGMYLLELCLYAATAGFIAGRFGTLPPLWLCIALFLAGEGVCSLLKNRPRGIRLLSVLPVAPLFFMAASPAAFIFLLLPAALLLARAFTGRCDAERGTVTEEFKYGCAAFFVLLLCCAANGSASGLITEALPYFTAFLLVSIWSMRLLREDAASFGTGYYLLNAGLLLLALGAGLFLSSEAGVTMLKEIAAALYGYILMPLLVLALAVLLAVPALLFLLIKKLLSLLQLKMPESSSGEWAFSMPEALDLEETVTAEITPWLKKAFWGLVILLALYLAYRLIRGLLYRESTAAQRLTGEKREALSHTPPAQARSLFPTDAAGSIRACYRRYLKLCRRHALPTDGTLLSDALAKESLPYTGESTQTLRRLWAKARYSAADCTREEAAEARNALKQIRAACRSYERSL